MSAKFFTTLFLITAFFFIRKVEAQTGDFYLKQFNVNLPNIDNNNYGITQDGQGRMHIANRQGVLRFDGTFWTMTTTPGTVLSIKYDPVSTLIFVGCINDYGYISKDNTGRESYTSLSKGDIYAKNIAKIEVVENFVYFLGENNLFEYSKIDKKIIHSYKETIENVFSFDHNIHVCFENGTISKLGITKFTPKKFNNQPMEAIIFSTPINETSTLVGTINNKLFILSGNTFKEIPLRDASYIENFELLDAVVMDKNTAVIATSKGGCLIVNIQTGETITVINYYSGLPDNEVYAIQKDRSGGVWIAHEFGITRLDYNLPFRCFSNYLGLEGQLQTAITFKGKLYVGTNEGIYILEQTKYYSDVLFTNVVHSKKYSGIKNKSTITEPKKTIGSTNKKDRFNFRDLFKRKNIPKTDNSINTGKNKKRETKKVITSPNTKETKSLKNILESVKYSYKKIFIGDLKCIQLIVSNNRLLAATNSGIFDIIGQKATPLCKDNIRYLYASKYTPTLYASTSHGEVLTFVYTQNKWNKIQLFDFIKQPISYIAEDDKKNLWLSGIDQVYRFTIDENLKIQDIYEQELKNSYSDDIFITNVNKKIYFSLSSSYYYFDYVTEKLVRDSLLENKFKNSEKIINSQSNILWNLKNKMWHYFADSVERTDNHLYLSLFRTIDELIIDRTNNSIWIITADNKLYNLTTKNNTTKLSKPDVFITDVKNGFGQFLPISFFSVQQNESNLLFDIVSADYYDQNTLEYQYKIIGLNKEWSKWSPNNTIMLNYLASGSYKIQIRSRNALGQITEKDALNFKIKPPYWQTWWFYLGEMVFFGILWILSFKLNRLNYGNQLIRKLLTFITLVLTVEFMSTVAESLININISPVVDFVVKVGIAILLFPFEQLLLKLIAKKQ